MAEKNLRESLPHEVESIKGCEAVVSLRGAGEVVELKCRAKVGDYVFIEQQAAIRKIDKAEAEEILGLLQDGIHI